jgi:hypothetical protein
MIVPIRHIAQDDVTFYKISYAHLATVYVMQNEIQVCLPLLTSETD